MGCRQLRPKAELLRIVKTPQDEVLLDSTGKVSGRGAYVCGLGCLKNTKRRHLSTALRVEIDDDLTKRLEQELTSMEESPKVGESHG